MTSLEIGRLLPAEVGRVLQHNAPEKQVAAMLSKMDEMINVMKSLTAKLDADAGVTDVNYASLLTNSLKKIELTL